MRRCKCGVNYHQLPFPRQDKLQQRLSVIHGQMGHRQAMRLVSNLEVLATMSKERPLDIGTACSGSDMPVMVWRRLMSYAQDHFDVTIHWRHRFSCEINPSVQEWIIKECRPQLLFDDICKLSDPMCHDVISKSQVPVPDVDIFIFGSECDNLSSANSSTRDFGCIKAGEGKSGTTAAGGFDFVEKCRPLLVVVENVANLDAGGRFADTDKTTMIKNFNSMGYYVDAHIYDAKDSGVPQSRRRFYLIAMLHSLAGVDQLAEDWVKPDYMDLLADLRFRTRGGRHKWDLEDFMPPRTHPFVQAWIGRPQENPQGKSKGKENSESKAKAKESFKFETDHLQAYSQRGMKWPPTEADYREACLWESIKRMPRRSQECVYYCAIADAEGDPHQKEYCRDFNLSLPWQVSARCKEAMPCLISSSKMFFMVDRREICPAEAMALQGWPFALFSSEWASKGSILFPMAGNAMNGFVLADVFLFICTAMPWARAMEAKREAKNVIGEGDAEIEDEQMEEMEEGTSDHSSSRSRLESDHFDLDDLEVA